MGTNAMIQHTSIPASNGSEASYRTVTIFNVGSDEDGENPIFFVTFSQTNKNDGPITSKAVNLLRKLASFTMRGNIVGDEHPNGTVTRTTLNESLSAVDTTITVTDATKLENAGTTHYSVMRIDDELIKYTGKSGNDLTGCVRGYGGTTAATHATGTSIYHPAIHFRNQIKNIFDSGTAATLYFPVGDPTLQDQLGSVSLDTNRGDTYSVSITKYNFKENPEDLIITDKYELQLFLTVSTDLI